MRKSATQEIKEMIAEYQKRKNEADESREILVHEVAPDKYDEFVDRFGFEPDEFDHIKREIEITDARINTYCGEIDGLNFALDMIKQYKSGERKEL